MSRTLSNHSNLDTLKKEAKRWLKALRDNDAEARRRLLAVLPSASEKSGLRDVQLALAREHGLSGWAALREALDDLAMAQRPHAERVEIVLRSAWDGDRSAATRILTRWPEIGTHDIYTAAATGNIAVLKRLVAADPAIASRKGGPLKWEPLLYLAYARLPDGDRHAIEMANILLDHGADPNATFDDGWGNPFKVLTGVIGQGEGDKPPHPDAKALALLLIERGADPYDSQALYNTSITRDDTTWLDFLWAKSEQRDRLTKWREIPNPLMGGDEPTNTLNYLLGNAVANNHIARAEWLLRHGANADGVYPYSKRPLREEALIYGHTAMSELLVRYGATAAQLEGQSAFQAACMQLDRETARALADRNPACLRDASSMLIAARHGRADVVALLLELGMNADVADANEQRGLHNAVAGDAIDVVSCSLRMARTLIAQRIRLAAARWVSPHTLTDAKIAALLAPLSRDIWELVYLGMTDRVRELLAADPKLANAVHPKAGITPLFCLPDDEEHAVEMTALLLAHGADSTFKNKEGLTAEGAARRRGLIDAADLMAGKEEA